MKFSQKLQQIWNSYKLIPPPDYKELPKYKVVYNPDTTPWPWVVRNRSWNDECYVHLCSSEFEARRHIIWLLWKDHFKIQDPYYRTEYDYPED